MKLFCWIILAGCVGAVGLGPRPRVGDEPSRGPGGDPSVVILGTHLDGPSCPAAPGRPADPARFAVDFDPEAESTDEAQLVAVGGLDRTPPARRVGSEQTAATLSPDRAAVDVASPRCFPIRC